MKKVITVLVSTLVVISFCAFIKSTEEKEYKLKLTATEINIAIKGLRELPFKESDPVLQKIVSQANDSTFQKK